MADKRAYFKLDVGYLTNPKVAALMEQSPTAIVLHVGSIAYSAQHLTDGEVPIGLLLRLTGATRDDADLLLAAGLWEQGRQDGLANVHDYLEHQRSSTEAKGASEAGKRGASARWHADRNAMGNADRMPDAMPDASESSMPREREEREREQAKAVSDDTAPPSRSLALVENRSDVDRICDHLAKAIESTGAKKPTITAKWRTEARLMLDRDGRTEAEVDACIRWLYTSAHKDALFWRPNVRAMPKLRAEYDRLLLLSQRGAVDSRQQATDDLFARAAVRMGVTQ